MKTLPPHYRAAKFALTMDETDREQVHQLLRLGTMLLEQGKAQEAIPHLESACQLDKENVPALSNLGGAYILAGRHRAAVPVLEAARDVEPENAMVWINLGAAYLGNPVLATPEQQRQAIVAFERAAALDPAAPHVHYNLALIHVDRGEFDVARAAFTRAVESNPLDSDAREWLNRLASAEASPGAPDEQVPHGT